MSQIPALLISVATGMIVTRSASENNLNDDVAKQFLSQPRVLIMASLAMFVLIFIGFPKVQVITVSLILMSLGIFLLRHESQTEMQEEVGVTEEVTSEASFYRNIDNVC